MPLIWFALAAAGIAGIYYVCLFVFEIFKISASAITTSGSYANSSLSKLLLWFLGGCNRKGTVTIHPHLLQDHNYKRVIEVTKSYELYEPNKSQKYVVNSKKYSISAHLSKITNDCTYSNKINFEDLQLLLKIPRYSFFESISKEYNDSKDYPIQAPSEPMEIAAPNPIDSYGILINDSPSLPDPSINLPLWENKLSFLNRFVEAKHSDLIKQYSEAKLSKQRQIESESALNIKLSEAYIGALERHQREKEKLKESFDSAYRDYISNKNQWDFEQTFEKKQLLEILNIFSDESRLKERTAEILRLLSFPKWMPKNFSIKHDVDADIIILELEYPDIGSINWVKNVSLKNGLVERPLNQKELKHASDLLYPSLTLRIACDLAYQLRTKDSTAIVINGWSDYTVKATGNRKRAYCASLMARIGSLNDLIMSDMDPLAAFASLKGLSARSLELTPIAPTIRIDMNDARFVESKEVIDLLNSQQNLASMDWEDFEHLCRELFERVFSSTGAVVKVTQASRDQGVDAIIMDPDPVRGGKIVIQAKRYVNTVDVSAVRDLYGTLMNEGAMKGILVSTSQFGQESYSFIQGKPLTLINGNELLGLLEQHGYKFRINLDEAKKFMRANDGLVSAQPYRGTSSFNE